MYIKCNCNIFIYARSWIIRIKNKFNNNNLFKCIFKYEILYLILILPKLIEYS